MKEEQTMTTLRVATDGDDSKDGSASSPLRTISRAADLARPGDTVLVHGGEYRAVSYTHLTLPTTPYV